MNIHEHQAKEILKKYGAAVPDGVFSHSVEELLEKAKLLKTEKLVLKAQIHAGGRGKAGGRRREEGRRWDQEKIVQPAHLQCVCECVCARANALTVEPPAKEP